MCYYAFSDYQNNRTENPVDLGELLQCYIDAYEQRFHQLPDSVVVMPERVTLTEGRWRRSTIG